ncbi:MAG: ABC transporter substrate-binding protein [Ardenticatenaceae bacterium]|nr:ABC transporter substrate-binding protein [Ardenticatenaceae bacterium]
MKRYVGIVVAALLLALVIAACGQAPTPQTVEKVVTQVVEKQATVIVEKQTTVVVEKQVTQVVEKVVTPTPGSAKKPGGTLRIAIGGDIDNYDPHSNPLDLYEDVIRNLVFDGLTSYDENEQVQPDLAESWEISPDSKTYTFHLRKEAKFHNGEPVTAKDVEFTFNRIKTMGTYINKRAQYIESIDVPDDHTIVFHMTTPQGWWIHDATFVAIVPTGSTTDTLKTDPIGTGPYKFKEWVPNDHITLEKNPDYWNPDETLVDQIVFRVLPDVRSAIANLQSGEVDAIREASVVDAVQFLSSEDIQVVQSASSNFFHFYHMTGLNNEYILKNKNVRKALAYALDKDAIQRSVFLGQGEQLTSPVPPSSPSHISPPGYPYDPEKCRQMLDAVAQHLIVIIDTTVRSTARSLETAAPAVWVVPNAAAEL